MTVEQFKKAKHVAYPQEEEIVQRILKLLDEYVGEISIVSVIGILDVVKDEIKDND